MLVRDVPELKMWKCVCLSLTGLGEVLRVRGKRGQRPPCRTGVLVAIASGDLESARFYSSSHLTRTDKAMVGPGRIGRTYCYLMQPNSSLTDATAAAALAESPAELTEGRFQGCSACDGSIGSWAMDLEATQTVFGGHGTERLLVIERFENGQIPGKGTTGLRPRLCGTAWGAID